MIADPPGVVTCFLSNIKQCDNLTNFFFSYFLIYGSTFATADFLPFVQTHLSEAIGFLKSFISVKTLCLGVILLLVLFVPTITLLVRNIKNGGMSSAKWPKWIIALSVLLFQRQARASYQQEEKG